MNRNPQHQPHTGGGAPELDGENLAGGRDLENEMTEFLEALRENAHIFLIDDSLSFCESTRDYLETFFPGRVDFATDPATAVEIIAQRAAKGLVNVLVVDMDMSPLTGKQLIEELDRRGIKLPFVILSGRQGSFLSAEFIEELHAAQSREELEAAVQKRLEATAGRPFSFVRKERFVMQPQILQLSVDAMLLASRHTDMKLNAMLEQELSDMSVPVADREAASEDLRESRRTLCAGMADECQAFALRLVEGHRKLLSLLTETEREEHAEKLGEMLELALIYSELYRFDDVLENSYDVDRCWGRYRHNAMGSRGLSKVFMMLGSLGSQIDGRNGEGGRPEVKRYTREFQELSQEFARRFEMMESRLYALNQMEASGYVDVRTMISTFSSASLRKGAAIETTGALNLEVNPSLLGDLIELPVQNALNAVENPSDHPFELNLGEKKVSEFPEELRVALEAKGHAPDAQLGFIEIEDRGPGYPQEVLDAWRERKEILRASTGTPCQGLALMRELVEDTFNGAVSISNGEAGAKVLMVLGVRGVEPGKDG